MMKTFLFSLTMVLSILPFNSYNFNVLEANSSKYIKNQDSSTNYRIKKIVIDPGHGGRDSGCSGHAHNEKDIALKISLQLGRAIKTQFPNIEVIYTRKSDVFVPLNERAAIANRNKADLFISIHCNAIENADYVYGSETYVMGLHKADANLAVAKRENASILLEADYDKVYGGYDPNSAEGHIILSMFQNAYLEQSILFAEKVERHIKHHARRKSRGVKQAGFVVLRETTMPSVLIETGYLTNSKDANYLATHRGQQETANSILKAFIAYKKEIEKRTTNAVYTNTPIERPLDTYQSKGIRQPTKRVSAPIHYKILLESSPRLVDTRKGQWTNLDYSIQVVEEKNQYKYYIIGFNSYKDASEVKSELRKKGFKEAFVVAYQNGQRVDLNKVR